MTTVAKFHGNFKSSPYYKRPKDGGPTFTIEHYAGTVSDILVIRPHEVVLFKNYTLLWPHEVVLFNVAMRCGIRVHIKGSTLINYGHMKLVKVWFLLNI